jgi:hypothetical protein
MDTYFLLGGVHEKEDFEATGIGSTTVPRR